MTKLFDFLSSVKLTVVLLVLVASLAILGTVIPQQEPPAHYVRMYGTSLARWFQDLGLTHLYSSAWFVALLGLLGLNLTVCSLRRIPKTWRLVKAQPALKLRDYAHMHFRRERTFAELPHGWKESVKEVLASGFSAPRQHELPEGTVFFARKFPWARMGVYVVHGSVLLLFAGAIIGAIWGFKGSVEIPEGATIHSIHLRQNHKRLPLDFAVRCDRFVVEFYENGAPKEYRSDLVFLKNGREVLKHVLRVNHPVTFEGITFYQSSYGTTLGGEVVFELVDNRTGKSYEVKGAPHDAFPLPDGKGTFRILNFNPNLSSGSMSFGPAVLLHVMGKDRVSPPFWVLQRFPRFDKERGGAYTFKLKSFEQVYYTGLQANRDPGVGLVYTGFLCMLAGFFITFFLSHQTVWVQADRKDNRWRVILAGTAHRNRSAFDTRMEKLWERLLSVLTRGDR